MPYTVGYHDAANTIAAGVGRGMQNLLGVLTDFADTKKREGAEADKLRGLLSIYEPDQKDTHKTIGLGELRSRAGAIAASQMKASEESKMAETLSQNRMRDTQRMGMEQAMAGNAALSDFSRDAMALNGAPPSAAALDANLGMFLQDPATLPPQPTSQEQAIRQALQMNPGAFMSPQFDNSLAALQKAMGGGDAVGVENVFNFDPARDVVDTGVGQKFIKTSKGGGQLVETPESLDARERRRLEREQALIDSRAATRPAVTATFDPATQEIKYTGDPEAVEEFVRKRRTGGAGPGSAGPTPTVRTQEVVRVTKDGRRAIFDSKTRQFLRYAD